MKKYSKNYVFYHLIIDFIVIFFVMLCMATEFISDEEGLIVKEKLPKLILYFILIFIFVYALKTVYSVLYYKTSGYELKQKEIVCKRGVLFKKRSILEYKKINAVNKKQNIIQKIFKIAVLTLDSGSANTAYTSEILIIEKQDVVDEILSKIKLKQNDDEIDIENTSSIVSFEEKENLYEFTTKKRFIYSFINVATTLFVLIVLTLGCLFVYGVVIPFAKNLATSNGLINVLQVLLYALLVYLIISLIVFIISVCISFLSYYKFSVYKNEKVIEINYGFFVKNNNTFKLNKIRGVVISQTLIQRLFKFVTVKLEVIGYNESGSNDESKNGSGLLFPLCKESEVKENLNKVLPSFIPVKKQSGAKKYFPFISWQLLFIGMPSLLILEVTIFSLVYYKVNTYVILSVVLGYTAINIIVIALVVIGGFLSYKNNGISFSDEKLTVYNGGFTRKATVIYSKNIIAMEDITTPLRKKCGIYSFKVHFRSNDQTNEIYLKNVNEELIDKLRGIVKY